MAKIWAEEGTVRKKRRSLSVSKSVTDVALGRSTSVPSVLPHMWEAIAAPRLVTLANYCIPKLTDPWLELELGNNFGQNSAQQNQSIHKNATNIVSINCALARKWWFDFSDTCGRRRRKQDNDVLLF